MPDDELPILPADLDPTPAGLDQLLLDEGWLEDPSVSAWRIEDDSAAEWSMRKLAGLRAEVADVALRARAWRDRIDAWEERVSAPLLRSARFFEGQLERYQLARRLADDSKKTLVLPSGTVASRPATSRLEFDEDLLAVWAVDRPELVRVKVEPEIAAVRKAFVEKDGQLVDPETGEVVPGVRVVVPDVPYSVTAKPS